MKTSNLPLYSSVNDTAPARHISLAWLSSMAKAPSTGPKIKARAITPYSADGKTKDHARSATYGVVVIDHDHDDRDAAAIACIYDSLGVAFLAYTTSTHQRPDKQDVIANRWRVIVPLAAPVDAERYQQLAQGIAFALGADPAQARAAQVFFAPNRENADAPYDFIDCASRPPLDAGNSSHPFVIEAMAGWADLQQERQKVAQEAAVRPRSTSTGDAGIIGRVVAQESLRAVLESAGYVRKGADLYLSPWSSTGNAGVHILERDGKEVAYSWHGTADPLSALNNGGHALDVFDVICILEFGGDVSRAVGALAPQVDPEGQRQRQREHMQAKAASQADKSPEPPPSLAKAANDEPFDLARFALNGQSAAMEARMLEDTFVLGRLAILGQATAFYAKPNSGKTLLTLWLLIRAIEAGQINPKDVFYINADDNFKGLVHKLKLAERWGFNQLAPGFNGFESAMFLRYLQKMTEEESASGKIVILDTLKKFTDLMDKTVATAFGKVVREFVSSGGTVIMLAHTNKHKSADGKSIPAGTSDIIDDADCAYVLDVIESDTSESKKTVIFENIKARGDVADTATYTYTTQKGLTYDDLLESVREVSREEAEDARKREQAEELLKKNAAIVEAIIEVIGEGVTHKTQLIEAAVEYSGCSKAKVTKALDDHTGTNYAMGHRWTVSKGEAKNARVYSLLLSFSAPPRYANG
ncbi:AAA family ATPase [Pseudomonas sp. AOB-7]|uniref:AAA family ATPase n=1 Tax=Pseudomonas sp. AOB-7 TaxID=2482750 RepID=UPI001314B878|nr:AAA family ATPase [Pseudomonas sp. AOB-7]